MLESLEHLLDLISRYGFPLIAAALFLITALIAIRGLWKEYRKLSDKYDRLINETARSTINCALSRLADIKSTLSQLQETIDTESGSDS